MPSLSVTLAAVLATAFALVSASVSAHSEHAAAAAKAAPESVRLHLPDAALLDRDGRKVRLNSDVLQDRIVVMDFVYTSCTTVCPVVSAILSRVQAALGERVGKEVRLVSLSIDPLRDTPARLKRYAAMHGAGAGWTWLTGTPQAVNDVLKGAGTYTPNFEDHPTVIMVGDARTGQWSRYYGFVDPQALLARVDALTAARTAASSGKPAGKPGSDGSIKVTAGHHQP